LIVRIFHLTVK